MARNDFEAAVTQGKAHWFTAVGYDEKTQMLVVGMTRNPELSRKTERVLEFRHVKSVIDDWTDRDDGCMETLLGAHEEPSGSEIHYYLVTDQREIGILAGTKVLIYEV